jgi:hypothetical protein
MTKEIQEAIRANLKSLASLDKEIEALSRESVDAALSLVDKDRKMPFWYMAYGDDQLPGVRLYETGENAASVGYIRVQSDSAFVATGIDTCYEYEFTQPTAAGQHIFANVYDFSQIAPFGVRLYDESSYRWVTLTNQDRSVQQNASVPTSLVSPVTKFRQSGFSLINECTFPRNALIRVEVYANDFSSIPLSLANIRRFYFSFCGYKVFGG